MIFWLWTNVAIRQLQFLGNENTLSDGTCGNTSNGCSLWEVLMDEMYQLLLYKRTNLRVSQSLTVVCIDR